MTTNHYKLTWERLGRGAVPEGYEMTVDATDRHGLAEQIHRFARRHLVSREFTVVVYDDGRVSIEAGRFGRGRWELLTTISDGDGPVNAAVQVVGPRRRRRG